MSDVPVALLSGSLQPGDPRATEAHLCAVLLKPFTNVALLEAMQHLIDTAWHDHSAAGSRCPLNAPLASPAVDAIAAPMPAHRS